MAEDQPTVPITSPTALAGAVPSLVGHQTVDNQVAVLRFRDAPCTGGAVRTRTTAMCDGPAHASDAARHITGIFADRAEAYLAIGSRRQPVGACSRGMPP